MRLEYLPDGSPDCPLIRLYDFDSKQAEIFRERILALAAGSQDAIVVDELPQVEAIDACRLVFKVSRGDRGILRFGAHNQFECLLTQVSWEQVAGLTEPFCEAGDHRGYFQWLDETSNISLLFSTDGHW
jgi:hypothetical protein